MSSHSVIEKCFEDAEDSGLLRLTHKGLKCFPNFVDDYDLVDVLVVDIAKNRFVELPQEILSFVMVERMDCSSNFLKTLPDLSNLNALTHLDVCQNQLQSLPVHICSLPLKILKASHNHLNVIPCEIGLLSKLQAMDISCNDLSNLPSTMGDLSSLRSLNVRRNQIVALPDELSKLKNLCCLDFSCNRISAIPPAFRLISSLIELDLTNNPLSSPPAQICLKGRLHIVKYLSLAAQQQEKRWSVLKDSNNSPSPTTISNNSTIERIPTEPYDATTINGVSETKQTIPSVDDTKEHDMVDTSMIAHSENDVEDVNQVVEPEVTKESKSPTSPSKPSLPKKPNTFVLTNQETKEKQKFLQEKGKLTPQFKTRVPTTTTNLLNNEKERPVSSTTSTSVEKPSVRVTAAVGQSKSKDIEKQQRSKDKKVDEQKTKTNIEARKEKLLKNKEEIIQSRQRLENLKSKNIQRDKKITSPSTENPELLSPVSTTSHASTDSNQSGEVIFDGIGKRGSLGKQRTSKKLKDGASNYTMRRFYDVAKEEFEQLEKLRAAMESKLKIKLPDDLPASLSDGIVLCHLINHLRKGTIQVIHVPSSGVPKLTMPKCQMNVDAFLDACRRVGVEKVDICTAPDILEEKSPTKLCRTVQALLQALGAAPPQISLAKPTTSR